MHIEVIESTFVNYLQVSNIVFEAVKTILDLFIIIIIIFFFFHEKILSVKKHQNAKQTIFTLLKVFVRAKKLLLLLFSVRLFLFC